MREPQLIGWDDGRAFDEVRPGIFGATVDTPQLTVTVYRYGPDSSWEEHQHPEDQVTTVLEGEIDFTVAGELVRMSAGQTATLPGGTPHSAHVAHTAVTVNVFRLRSGV
jgi:quercetin dioxygenase-like cupin family protein